MGPEVMRHVQKLLGLLPATEPVQADPTDDILEPLHEALWHEFQTREIAALPVANEIGALGAAWWVVTNRQAKSAVVIRRQGADIDAMPNARTAFEYAMGVVWLSRGQGVPAVHDLTLRWIRDHVHGFRFGLESFPQLGSFIEGLTAMQDSGELPSGKPAFTPGDFKWLTGQLGIQDIAYQYYPTMSGYVHPSLAAFTALMDISPDGITIHRTRFRRQPEVNALLWAVQCQCWAGLAVDRILEGGLPFCDLVSEASDQINLPLRDRLFPT